MKRLMDIVEAIELRPFAELDSVEHGQILAVRNEPGVRENMYTHHEISPREHEAWMERTIKSGAQMFAVSLDGKIVGTIGLTSVVPSERRAEWAFYLSAATQGKGIGSALEFKFLSWAFAEQKLHKLNCEVLAFNASVIALHKKFGFREEGTRRDHIRRNDEWIDTILLGMTEDEWACQEPMLRERLFK